MSPNGNVAIADGIRFMNTEKNKNIKALLSQELPHRVELVLIPIARFLHVPHLTSLIWINF